MRKVIVPVPPHPPPVCRRRGRLKAPAGDLPPPPAGPSRVHPAIPPGWDGQGRVAGFTLIELLAVIAVVGVLAAVLAPVVGKVRFSARSTVCASNLRQLGLAFALHAEDNRGRLPAPRSAPDRYWFTELHRYCGARPPAGNEDLLTNRLAGVFLCPEWTLEYPGLTSPDKLGYAMCGNLRPGSIAVEPTVGVPLHEIRDPAHTLLVIEHGSDAVFLNSSSWGVGYTAPAGVEEGLAGSGRHDTHANYLFVAGQVRSMTPAQARECFSDPPEPGS